MLGITIFPEYIQSEGPEALLDNLLAKMPLTAVSTSPYVMEECPAELGGEREPPADSDKGLARLLNRPLWDKNEVWVSATPSFEPNEELYQGLRYQPLKPSKLTQKEGPVIDRFIQACHDRNIQIFMQIQSAIPPGYRVQFGGAVEEDMPRMPDGSITPRKLDNNGSLASEEILAYGEALIKDLMKRYPTIDGIRIDWPEYPPYFLESAFLDFGDHAKGFAKIHGIDFEAMRRKVATLYTQLTEKLTDQDLQAYLDSPDSILKKWSGCAEWIDFKSLLVSNLLRRFKAAIGDEKMLFPSSFPPPWNRLSGFNFQQASEIVDAISCKYYTMHWPMMLRNYADSLTEKNQPMNKALLAECLAKAFNAYSPIPSSSDDIEYPQPKENHPVDLTSLAERQVFVEGLAGGTPVWALGHAYGPVDDFKIRAEAVYKASSNRLWINRYGYLGNAKIEALASVFK
tara:strand:+ start:6427 stop:7797 length:1371 start_codon:yes stop_codon:yes gene_type:complete